MYISLETIDVWTFEGEFSADAFLRDLGTILRTGDVLAFGAYSPTRRLVGSLSNLGATQTDADVLYKVSFEFNRHQHPHGRSFELAVDTTVLAALADEAARIDGQDDKPLFFDHVIAYRRGTPTVPLICFHDAFTGGELLASGLYSAASIQTFASGLPSTFKLQRNPENYPAGI